MHKKILFIGHDANFAGAQYLLLHLLTYLKSVENVQTMLVLGSGGGLEADFTAVTKVSFWKNDIEENNTNKYFKKIAKVANLEPLLSLQKNKGAIFKEIEAFDPDLIFSNTIANGDILQKLNYLGTPFFIYCHEMEKSINTYSSPAALSFQLNNAAFILTGSEAVKQNLVQNHQINNNKLGVFASYIDCNTMEMGYQSVDKKVIKAKIGISNEAIVVGGCGLIEWRKGIDIFNYTALQILKSTQKEVHFVWVGVTKNSDEYYHLKYDLERMGIADRVHLIEGSVDIINYTACFDIFFMSSREDPYPLVMIEAGLNKIPVVCFGNSGGAVDFVGQEKELIVPYLDIYQASKVIIDLIEKEEKRVKLGEIFYKKAWEHDITVRGPQILEKILELK
jgi:glycosyltransferase involved in cell wall biosynthesis